MQMSYNSEKINSEYKVLAPRVGMVLAAKYSVDDKYYRARVTELLGGQKVKLKYVDFGNETETDSSNLFKIQDQFLKVPSLSTSVSLSEVTANRNNQWSRKATVAFKERTSMKVLTMFIDKESKIKHTYDVILYENLVDKDICINAWLVKEGHGTFQGSNQVSVEYPKIETQTKTKKGTTVDHL